ncbi:MAG: Na+/H+ antiporter subunit E [Planctomycetota bacterium]
MIQGFLVHLVLVVIYLALTGDVSFVNIVFGVAIAYGVMLVFDGATQQANSYSRRILGLAAFSVYFVRILIIANLEVAREILTPGYQMTPRLLRYNVAGMTDLQITWLANAITLTPGTLSVDLDPETDCLYIHAMYGDDRDALVAGLDELKTRLLKGVFGQ